jgi:Xaa-Pro aminopeptidase
MKKTNWHSLGPGELALSEWQTAGLKAPDLAEIRSYRLARVRQHLRKFDYAGIVLFDPINVRYATDSTNMQIWLMHNAARYVFLPTEGPVILFDDPDTTHLNSHSDVIDEIRTATGWYYFAGGHRYQELAKQWATEIASLIKEHSSGNMRLAIDRCNPEGVEALHSQGIQVCNGEEVMELSRSIKCTEEINAMRCAIHACEQSVEVMRQHLAPGISEQQLWSYLHAENIARGGEWIETCLLASGERTNPWYQECSSRIIQRGDLVVFDTDLIGSYGMCVDISRAWICGDATPNAEQREIYDMSYEQILRNTECLKPGLTFKELTFDTLQYNPEEFRHYSCLYHGVGLCDEYPSIYFRSSWECTGYNGVIESGMILCVESFVGRRSGGPGVKLEEQVLITDHGHEVLSRYPIKEILTN